MQGVLVSHFTKSFTEKYLLSVRLVSQESKCKTGEVFNFTKDRLCHLVPHRIWEIFATYISCTPAASYFYYYVMPQSFLLATRVFSLYLFQWQHWEITSEHLFNNISSGSSTISDFSCKYKLHLFELGLYDL